MIAALRTGYVQRGRSDCGSASEAGAIVDEDAGGSNALLEAGDAGELCVEVVGGLGVEELGLAEEVASLGVLELLLCGAVENTDRLEDDEERDTRRRRRRETHDAENSVALAAILDGIVDDIVLLRRLFALGILHVAKTLL